MSGVTLGYLSYVAYRFSLHLAASAPYADAALWREILLGSLIAALLLREPLLAAGRQMVRQGALTRSLCQRGAMAVALLLSVGLATRALDDMARLWVLEWAGSYAVWVALSRCAVVARMGRLAAQGDLREAVAVVGDSGFVERLAACLAEEADVVAVLSDDDEQDEDGLASAIIGVQELANTGVIDTVVLALAFDGVDDAAALIDQLKAFPVQVSVCTERMQAAPSSLACRMLGGVPLAVVADRPLPRWGQVVKTVMDKVGALALMLALAPFMMAAALAILVETPGPVIFRQQRRGWGGRDFVIYKFRTMHHGTAKFAFRQTERGDVRCTWVGAILRSSSLDELPQLWNVLRGDMSLVGPRPHSEPMPYVQEVGCKIISEYAQRQRVKPGMTGWAQINGLRGAVRTTDQMRRRVHYDLYYIDNWSVWLDLYILACTPLCVLRAQNAY